MLDTAYSLAGTHALTLTRIRQKHASSPLMALISLERFAIAGDLIQHLVSGEHDVA